MQPKLASLCLSCPFASAPLQFPAGAFRFKNVFATCSPNPACFTFFHSLLSLLVFFVVVCCCVLCTTSRRSHGAVRCVAAQLKPCGSQAHFLLYSALAPQAQRRPREGKALLLPQTRQARDRRDPLCMWRCTCAQCIHRFLGGRRCTLSHTSLWLWMLLGLHCQSSGGRHRQARKPPCLPAPAAEQTQKDKALLLYTINHSLHTTSSTTYPLNNRSSPPQPQPPPPPFVQLSATSPSSSPTTSQ